MPSSHLILCRPLLLLPPIPPSIKVLSNESTLHMRWPKYWSFSFSIIPSQEIPGLISFRMDWLDLLAVQGTLKSLLQHHSSKASILQCSAFFIVQLSNPYMNTGKTIALTRRTLVGKVMSLLLNILTMSKMLNKVKIHNSHTYQRGEVIGQTAAPKLERQTGRYKESQLTRAKPSTGTKSTVGKPKLYLENCWRFTVDKSES